MKPLPCASCCPGWWAMTDAKWPLDLKLLACIHYLIVQEENAKPYSKEKPK